MLAAVLDPAELQAGDLIAPETPGGIALTVRNRRLYRWRTRLLFWWNARDWHDVFSRPAMPIYLHERLSAWVRGEVESGRYVPAAKRAELLLSIARGELDERSGSYLDAGAWPMRAAVPGVA